MEKYQTDLLYLMACALNNRIPENKRVEIMDLEKIYTLSEKHSVAAMTDMALESAGAFQGDEKSVLKSQWMETKERAVRKNLLLKAERQVLFKYMDLNRIWHMPLKGAVIESMYPRFGMREMADQDILFDPSYQTQICEWMEKRGYHVQCVGMGNHDVYEKPPVYNFELHTSLIGEVHKAEWRAYYQDVKARLIRDDANGYGYHFSDEDFYVYMMVHALKHFSNCGTGVRTLADIYVYVRQKESTMDWNYIQQEVEKLDMVSFEYELRQLSIKLFSGEVGKLTASEEQQLEYMVGSGTYGTVKNDVENKIKKFKQGTVTDRQARVKYIWSRIWKPDEECKLCYPIVYRHKWLKPFLLVYRGIKGITVKRERLKNEIKIIRGSK